MCALSCIRFFVTQWTVAPRLLCQWNFPGKNTGTGCHFLFQRSSPPRDQIWGLPHWQADSLPLYHFNKHILLLSLGKRYVTNFLLKLESDGDQACDQPLQPAGCVLTFQRLYVTHVIYVNRSLNKILSIKLGLFLVAQWSRIYLQCKRYSFHPWIRKNPCRRKWHPTPVFLPGKSHGQRSLGVYSP